MKLENKDPIYYRFLNDLWTVLNESLFKVNQKDLRGLDMLTYLIKDESIFKRSSQKK